VSDTLADVVAAAAAGLAGPMERQVGPDGQVEYLRGGRAFSAVDPDGAWAAFHLTPSVAAAALRTPDTEPSTRGRGWVTLRPAILDGHAVDRATAWFESAWRAKAD
jgi:hypothetical protein